MTVPGNLSSPLLATAADAAAAADVATKSLRFNSGDSANLSRTPSSASNRKTWTWSAWVKRGPSSSTQTLFKAGETYLQYYSSTNTLYTNLRGGSTNYFINYANVYRDPSAWYHIVLAVDTTQATSSNRQKLYVNGVQLTEAGSLGLNYPPQNDDTTVNSTTAHYIGGTSYFDGYLADIHFIDGSQLDPTSFGAFDSSGVWQAAEYSGTFGTNGFHLKFADASSDSALGTDSSGNNNDFTVNNITAKASGKKGSVQNFQVVTYTGTNASKSISLPFKPDFVWTKSRSRTDNHGIHDSVRGRAKNLYSDLTASENTSSSSADLVSFDTNGYTLGTVEQTAMNRSGETYVAWCWNAGDNSNKTYTVKVVDDSGNKYRFDDFGTSAVTLDLAEGSTYVFDQSDSSNSGHPLRFSTTSDGTHNSGTEYTTGVTTTGTPGSAGAKTTIVIPGSYSDQTSGGAVHGSYPMSQTFDGSTSTTGVRAVSGGGFVFGGSLGISYSSSIRIHSGTSGIGTQQFKLNDGTATDMAENTFVTVATGSGTLNKLEITAGSTGNANIYLGAIEVDGHILQDNNTTPTLYYYCSSHSGMGGQANTNDTEGASNFDGTIQAKVKANQDFGFSVATYTGNASNASFGHGLGNTPKMVWIKGRGSTFDWRVHHESFSTGYDAQLNQQAAATSASTVYRAAPTSSVVNIGTGTAVNGNSYTYVAYCWSEISGFSKISTYTGSGSSQTIDCGFKPKFVLIKNNSVSNDNWYIFDSERLPNTVWANGNNAESSSYSSYFTGFTDSGFTVTGSNQNTNKSGDTYIFMAFAGTPAGENDDSVFDVPTNGTQSDTGAGGEVSGNYATLNPLAIGSDATLSNGNLDVSYGTGSTRGITTATIGMSSGKWYWEATFTASSATNTDGAVGITTTETGGTNYPGHQSTSWGYLGNGNKYNNGSGSSYGDTFGAGDVIGIAFDADGGNLYFYKNGVVQNSGTAAYTSLTSGPYFAAVGDGSTNSTFSASFNFGQREFHFDAPSGYKALCTTNLPTPTIADGSEYFDIVAYTSTTQSPRTVTGLNIAEPDWVWVKNRNDSSPHLMWDAVRGTDNNLRTDTTNTESAVSGSSNGIISTSATNGFVVKNGSSSGTNVGSSGTDPIVAWCWDAGSSTVSNTDGDVTSSVRANTTAGVSIVSWTNPSSGSGAFEVGHSLNAAPSVIFIKPRSNTGNWNTFHSSVSTDTSKFLNLNTTDSLQTYSGLWGSALPTSSVFGLGNNFRDGYTMVAYCISPVAGFSAVGSYVGNGSDDGPFVHTNGMRPSWLLVKRSSGTGNWILVDTTRSPFNTTDEVLIPNSDVTEQDLSAYTPFDILSNGFKLRDGTDLTGTTNINVSGSTYIYIAFASNPFQANGGLAR